MFAERVDAIDWGAPRGERVVLLLKKGEHVYSFVWDPQRPGVRDQVLQQLGRFASRADIDFTWADAAVIAKQIGPPQ